MGISGMFVVSSYILKDNLEKTIKTVQCTSTIQILNSVVIILTFDILRHKK